MLDQFYNYLTDKIINYFRNNPLNPGDKFYIQFEEEEQVKKLYLGLKENTLFNPFIYHDPKRMETYETYYLNFGSVKLIVASTYDDVHPDFLANLRNYIGVEDEYFNKAILFIHNSTLDSILGGTGSFHKEGMPLSIKSIAEDIRLKLNVSNFSDIEKAILTMYLENKQKELEGGNPTVFEYKELLSIIEKSSLNMNEYKNFGLFPDSNLGMCSGSDLKKRLEDNAVNFSRIAEMHNYGLSELKLEKYYDEKGVARLKKDDWGDVEYEEIKKYISNKKNKPSIEYLPMSNSNIIWDREEGSTKAKFRIRNIIIFNNEEKNEYELEFYFNDYVKKSGIQDSQFANSEASGKRIVTKLSNIKPNANFYLVKYKNDNTTFQFRIVVINCESKYLNSIKTCYSVITKGKENGNYVLINSDESAVLFNEYADDPKTVFIKAKDQLIYIEDNKLTLNIDDEYQFTDDDDMVYFQLCINDCVIPFEKAGENERPVAIEGIKVWKLKRDNKTSFEYPSENKLVLGTKSYFAREEFKNNLELEKMFIIKGVSALYENADGFHELQLTIKDEINEKYNKIIKYFTSHKTLPSLAYLELELKQIYLEFVAVFLEEVKSFKNNSYLTQEQKDLFFIGAIVKNIGEKELLLTPLHPLNIAYQLHVDKIDTSTISDDDIELLQKFQQLYMLPFINTNPSTKEKCILIPIEQNHSFEWKTYVNEDLPRYKGSKDYVSKLVSEKIEEFVDHFEYLFSLSEGAPIIVNLVNTGDSKEILQGIFKYYVKSLRNKSVGEIIPMMVNVYVEKNVTNAFDEFASVDDVYTIQKMFHLDLNVDGMNEDEIVDLYREKVQFYSKDINAEELHFAHITFIEMLDESNTISTSMDDIPSGVVFNGITSGTASTLLGDTFRTGFGTKYAVKNSQLMELAINLNAINAAINGDQYSRNKCVTLSIPNRRQTSLDKVYDASNWVTFINPKVDLSYFKNDPNSKDLIIIHYSDQYNTTSSGYDAITVTRKSCQYQTVIEEYLSNKGVFHSKEKSTMVINTFNAVNGDWLLRLLSNKSYFPKEKLSILSAIKYAINKFKIDGVIWIPISLEEVLRVSGGVGLKKNSLFSAKSLGFENNGATSDDILLIGILNSDRPQVTFYPIEVKVGKNTSDTIDKGIKQAKETKRIFRDVLQKGDDIKNRIYRNFFMQLAVSSAEKLVLYEIGDGNQGWEDVVDSELRMKILNEEFDIVDTLNTNMGEACVLSFKASSLNVPDMMKDDVLIIEESEISGINMIAKKLDEIVVEPLSIQRAPETEKVEKKFEVKKTDAEDENARNEITSELQIDLTENENMENLDDLANINIESANGIKDEAAERNIEILLGTKQDVDKPLFWYPNNSSRVRHTNTGIIGTMGTGKTQFTKSFITQIYRESKYNLNGGNIGILIFDYKGDYNKTKQDFVDATNAKIYSLYDLPFNPLSLTLTEHPKSMLPLHTANSLKETISKAFGLGIKQETLLRELIMEAYEKFGIIRNDSTTWTRQAPTLQDVYDIYINKDDIKEDSLYAAFSNIIEFQIFERDGSKTVGLYELIDGVTVIDLSTFDAGIQNLVVAITLDLFYSQMQGYGHSLLKGNLRQLTKFILVDEADNFLSKDFNSLKKILKEGREFGVGTILSTQLLSHFSTGDNEYANYILTWVIHNVSDLTNKDIRYIFNTKGKLEEANIFNKIKCLQNHYSLVKMGDNNNPICIRDKAFWELDK